MHKEAIEAFLTFNKQLAEEALKRGYEAEMIFCVSVRLLTAAQNNKRLCEKIQIETPMQILAYRLASQSLNRISRLADRISKEAIEFVKYKDIVGKQLIDEVWKLDEAASSICNKAITAMVSRSITLANNAIEDYTRLIEMEDELQREICTEAYLRSRSFATSKYFSEAEPCMVAKLSGLLALILNTGEEGANIAKVAMNMALEEPSRICNPIEEISEPFLEH
jgi:phosphate uptake regulator